MKRTFIFFSVLTYCSGTILRLPTCNKYAGTFSIVENGYKLVNSVTITTPYVDIHNCMYACMLHTKCKSCSVSTKEKICLLHHSRNEENGAYLQRMDGWTFYTTPSYVKWVSTCYSSMTFFRDIRNDFVAGNILFGNQFGNSRSSLWR